MYKLLSLTLLILESFANIPFSSYVTICNAVGNTNCYTLYNDPVLINFGINYIPLQLYQYTIPWYTGVNMSIGWAQSHGQAFSYRVMQSYALYHGKSYPNPPIFSDLSFVRGCLEQASTCVDTCSPPQFQDKFNNTLIHLPFFFGDDGTMPIATFPSYFYSPQTVTQWCNLTHLKQENLTGIQQWLYPGYYNMQVAYTTPFANLKAAMQRYGIGYVAIPYDYAMAANWGYYPSFIYSLYGPMLFYYPANVVGVYVPGNNTIYLIVYAFGAQNSDTNYLIVDFSMVSLPNWITFVPLISSFTYTVG